jgi:hypothetical protein
MAENETTRTVSAGRTIAEASVDARTLETLVDRYTLSGIVACLSSIAYGKAEHVAENWQDAPLSKVWQRAGRKLDSVAAGLQTIAPEVL